MSQSNLLKVSLKERRSLQTVLNNCKEWKHDACSLLQDALCLFDVANCGDGLAIGLTSDIENLLPRIESAKTNGLSLGFELNEIQKLEDACSTLQWCKKALSFCSVAPSFEV